MIDGIYYFGDQLRWNLGWPNPNVAGAFIACLLPLLWMIGRIALRAPNRARWLLPGLVLTGELVLWYVLAKTYSRGALIGAIIGGGVFFLIIHAYTREPAKYRIVATMNVIRISGIALILWFTAFAGRIDPQYLSADESAGNRIVLWSGGLQMIAASPLDGWGVGNSGMSFMHWYQPVDSEAKYAGMVNSYLHIGVERGMPLLWAVLFTATLLWVMGVTSVRTYGRKGAPTPAFISAGATAVLTVFLVVNIFSTLWIVKGLWWMPAAAALAIFALFAWAQHGRKGRLLAGNAGLAAAMSGACILMLVLTGHLLNSATKVMRKDGAIVLTSTEGNASEAATLYAYPDAEILGDEYGKELRRLLLDLPPGAWQIRIPAAESSIRGTDADIELYFGGKIATLTGHPSASMAKVIVVHPTVQPEQNTLAGRSVSLILPEFDFFGSSAAWQKAAASEDWPTSLSQETALDIRQVWPEVLVSHLDKESRE